MAGLYFHIPFCRRKCPYCDFFSLADYAGQIARYPDLLLRHLKLEGQKETWSGPFETVFFGGGTPSLLEPKAIGQVLETAEKEFGFAPQVEISLEANPGTVSPAILSGYRAAGINRLSLGIQSLDPDNLKRLDRIHSPEEARSAAHWARRAGFDNLSCDLMFALPGQSAKDLRIDLDRFLDLSPEHMSVYGLTVEEETPFYHLHRAGGLDLPDEDCYAELFYAVDESLGEAGFGHYEISNYARPGYECRHNLGYWQRAPYWGVGAGAHSFIAAGWGERRAIAADLERYETLLDEGSDPSERIESFDRLGAMAETLYLGLRTGEGVDDAAFHENFGIGVAEAFPQAVQKAEKHLRFVEGYWRLDLQGWLLFDHLIRPFL